jgi:transcriptional regulator with XRE-family HTH domain
MTTFDSALPHHRPSPARASAARRPSHPQRGRWTAPASQASHVPAAAGSGDDGKAPATRDWGRLPAPPPGVIGAAVIKTARRSAGLSLRSFARQIGISPATLRAWETGTCPLYAVRYDQLSQAASVLGQAGAVVGRDVGELVVAGQCDLLITGMLLGFEDYAEVPPVDHGTNGTTARSLLRWALTGQAPEQYSAYTTPGPLLAAQDIASFMAIAENLREGVHGTDLASYGTALTALAGR